MIRRDVCKKCVWMRNLAGTMYCPLPKCIYEETRPMRRSDIKGRPVPKGQKAHRVSFPVFDGKSATLAVPPYGVALYRVTGGVNSAARDNPKGRPTGRPS